MFFAERKFFGRQPLRLKHFFQRDVFALYFDNTEIENFGQ